MEKKTERTMETGSTCFTVCFAACRSVVLTGLAFAAHSEI